MTENQPSENLKGTWNQAILTFLFPILLVMGLRWALIEPFVIPSGSMIPNLLVHDHILVRKFSYGLHVPFSDKWLVKWNQPERGQVVVFKYPENPDVYYIKRLIGLPGDEVQVQNGRISVNGEKWELTPEQKPEQEPGFVYFEEKNKSEAHTVRFLSQEDGSTPETFKVPAGHYFFMGDNRDQSSDSRYWGFVKEDYLVGRAWMVWLSCDSTLPTMTFVCDPTQIRWNRLFHKVN
ncbi:signal peptidase I [Bdellovibrio sp. HCB2-146]|uniref:signal peptidase I n=1 Tax=Bdellovibrio sp. HCB2-146 TaxID=3394362 RepID=UPI0039BCAD0E